MMLLGYGCDLPGDDLTFIASLETFEEFASCLENYEYLFEGLEKVKDILEKLNIETDYQKVEKVVL